MESYEQKYKEALGWMKSLYGGLHGKTKEEAEKYFPELKESEDEQIRKAIIDFFKSVADNTTYSLVPKKDILTWLEKQGQQKPIVDGIPTATNYDNMFQNCKLHKFKVGDWVTCDKYGAKDIDKIVKFDNDKVSFESGEWLYINQLNEDYKLWTINDAKDGDILVNGSNIFIFSYLSDTRAMGYCHINLDDGRFYDDKGKNECFGLIDAVFSPATKEQHDLLFEKMREAGYEWNAEKKKLKKIEPNLSNSAKVGMGEESKWSEEDEGKVEDIVYFLNTANLTHYASTEAIDDCVEWLKSLKQRLEGQR